MMKKLLQTTLVIALTSGMLSCNTAQNGFNAPDGSSVSYITQAIDLKFSGSGEILQLATVKVAVDVGTGSGSAGSSGVSSANEIQGTIRCVHCNLYVFKNGVTTFLPQSSLLNPVAAKSFAFKTESDGTFTFVIGVVSPVDLGFIDTNGDPLSYSDNVISDIGVSQAALAVSGGPAS